MRGYGGEWWSMFGMQLFSHGGEALNTGILKVSFLFMEMFQKYILFLPSKVEYTSVI